ncbi:MAG: transcription termination factor NusA [Candidatus Sumerlaea chitinivorans]|nr:transcription termination factor NusA [Candidatus Sumerlaea chitinivorans]
MNANELKALVQYYAKERELDLQVVAKAIEDSIVAAARKSSLSQFKEPRAQLDPTTGVLHLWVKKTVVSTVTSARTQISLRDAKKINKDVAVGDEIEVEVDPAVLGHLAIANMKQFLIQKLREAERNKIYNEWHDRVGEVVTATVQRYEHRDLIVQLGRAEALLPAKELPPNARYRQGDKIKVLITRVEKRDGHGPMITVSRTHPELVVKLFEQEVPEVADGTVEIVKVARDPGVRTKLAVQSKNPDVDPVGACVGVGGSRVQMIVRELENERIDIIPYSPKIEQFVANALVPAQISSVKVLENERKAIVTVKEGQLALAIGKSGQNARLAAKLTGLALDIHAEGEEKKLAKADPKRIQREYLADFLSQEKLTDAQTVEMFLNAGYESVEAIANADAHDIAKLLDRDVDWAEEFVDDARAYVEQLREMRKTTFGTDETNANSETDRTQTGQPKEATSADANAGGAQNAS